MFVLLGLDGLAFSEIKPDCVALKRAIKKYTSGKLICDGIPHSAPSWTTIYTGAKYQEHGIYEYWYWKNDEAKRKEEITFFKTDDIKKPLLWEVLKENGKKAAVYNFCGLISAYNTPHCTHLDKKWLSLETCWPATFEECLQSLVYQRQAFEMLIDNERLDFLGFTNTVPDKLFHLKKQGKISASEYRNGMLYFNAWFADILRMIEEGNHTFLAVSDHGTGDGGKTKKSFNGWHVPTHNKEGIFITNHMPSGALSDATLLGTTLDVFPFVMHAVCGGDNE